MVTPKPQKTPINYNCDICDFNSFNKKDYNRHLSTRKNKILTNPKNTNDKTPKNPKKKQYECNKCFFLYLNCVMRKKREPYSVSFYLCYIFIVF